MNRTKMLRFWLAAALAIVPAAVPQAASAAPPANAPSTPVAAPSFAIIGCTLHVGDGKVIEDAVLVVDQGRIVKAGKHDGTTPAADRIIDGKGKIVTPGFIGADTSLGLVEIDMEGSTRDQSRATGHHVRSGYDPAPAIFADSSLIQIQAVEGITSAAVAPGGGLLSGGVAWIDLIAGDYTNIVAARSIAIDGSFGQTYGGSRAATLAELRRVFDDAKLYARSKAQFDRRQLRDLAAHPRDLEALGPVLAGRIPLSISADRAGDILALLELAQEYGIRLVIVGGAEAWKVAPQLAAAKVPVVLRPSQNLPGNFERLGARLDSAKLLHDAGVAVVIANPGDAHNVRNIKQEAGIAVAYGLPHEAALSAITLEAARAYGMERDYGSLEVGKVANVVMWDADPFELSSFPEAVFIRGREIPLRSRQTELRDRYMKRHGMN